MAGLIPQQFIDELMTRVSIVDVIDARVPLRKTGRDYMARCPFHEEKTPSFTVSQQKQFYHCFGCGAHGTALGFLMEYEHMDFVEAVRDLASQMGMEVPREPGAPEVTQSASKDLYAALEASATFYRRQLREHPDAERAIGYLKRRGLIGQTAAHYGIGFAPAGWDKLLRGVGKDDAQLIAQLTDAGMLMEKEGGGRYDRFRDRIMFPIVDQRGRTMGFGGRVLSDEDSPKYLNSPETTVFHKGHELYGLYQARKASRALDRLLVVEGYMDVVVLAQFGIDYAIATMGTSITAQQVERMFRMVSSVIFCFDGDLAGREAAWRALEAVLPTMSQGRQVSFLLLPEGEDPDSLVRKEGRAVFIDRLHQAQPFSQFFYETLARQVHIGTLDGRARLVELAKPLLSRLPDGVFHRLMVQRLAEIVHMDTEKLSAAIDPHANKSVTAKSQQKNGRKPSARSVPRPMSPARLAIALLLQHPELASQAGDPQRFAELTIPGADLLAEVLELLRMQPHLTTGALLEHWRGRTQGDYLLKLAQWRHPLDGTIEQLAEEFGATLNRLSVQGLEDQRQRLIDQSLSRS